MNIKWIINDGGEIGILFNNKTYFLWKWHDSFLEGSGYYREIDFSLDFKEGFLLSKYFKEMNDWFHKESFNLKDQQYMQVNGKMHWIVNKEGELGVYINGKTSFLSQNPTPNNEWRVIYKREFGESCRPSVILSRGIEGSYIGFHNEPLNVWVIIP